MGNKIKGLIFGLKAHKIGAMKWAIIALLLPLLAAIGCAGASAPVVRPAVLAGQWYPGDPSVLGAAVDDMMARAGEVPPVKDPLLFVLPHAGYPYSGAVAAAGYSLMKKTVPGLIVILAPPHRAPVRGCALSSADFFETPLGRVKLEKNAAMALAKKTGYALDDEAHRLEHAVEIHLPFLQRVFGARIEKDIPILPILVGDIGPGCGNLARELALAVKDRRPLFIVSSDFTHYGPRFGYRPFSARGKDEYLKKQKDLDMGAIMPILRNDAVAFEEYVRRTEITVCGRNPILLALNLPLSVEEAKLLRYDTSCGVSGDCENSVSYAALALGGALDLSRERGGDLRQEDREFLLALARRNISSHLTKGVPWSVREADVPPACRARRGVFVTLKKRGGLRGCIGTVLAERPLFELVMENSYNAAFRDPRFTGLSRDEFDDIVIEISVLSEPLPVNGVNEIEVGRDGLFITMGGRSGLLLPQVPVEQGWTREEFLVF